MLEYIKGVSQAVLTGEEGVRLSFFIADGAIVSDVAIGERQEANTQRLHRATTFEKGVAVGENLLASL